MPGFCIEKRFEGPNDTPELKIVDTGCCTVAGSHRAGATAAAWVHLGDDTQWRVYKQPDRLLVVEGEPDRFPAEEEALERWLPGRWGSFRGFEITPARVRAFVDPLGTRPLWYVRDSGCFRIADRLSTLAVNCDQPAVCWPIVLEAMMLNTVYSTGSTLQGAVRLLPGETVEFSGAEARSLGRNRLPVDEDIEAAWIREDPGAALLRALEKAVQETWRRSDSWLLLSGGLDSRITLALAGRGRKTLTVTTKENTESRAARQIAERCGAEFRHWARDPEHYLGLARRTVYITGAMWNSIAAHHLGLGQEWRRAGITAVAHAYLYDTLLKGSYTLLDQPYAPANPRLYEVIGELESCFQKRSCRSSEYAPDDVLCLLSDEGRAAALDQMRRLSDEMPLVRQDGLNVTLERQMVSSISRACSYSTLLGWMEELSVSSPIFHPALWTWHLHSRPRDRYLGKAFRRALQLLGHPVFEVVDSNTGRAVSFRPTWRDTIRQQPAYRLARSLARRIARPKPRAAAAPDPADEGSWPPLAPIFRSARGREVLEEGLGFLAGCELFDTAALEKALASFLGGNNRYLEPVLAAMTAGRWLRLVRGGADCTGPHTRDVAIAGPTPV
jgi:hypothetical protein